MIQLTPRVDIDHFENHWRNVFLANLGKKNFMLWVWFRSKDFPSVFDGRKLFCCYQQMRF